MVKHGEDAITSSVRVNAEKKRKKTKKRLVKKAQMCYTDCGDRMKIAVVGSRTLSDRAYETICQYIPVDCTEIISGGAEGVDRQAERYAREKNLKITVIRPDYKAFDRSAPLIRNAEIVRRADYVLVIWDGKSRGSHNVIMTCLQTNKPYRVLVMT